MNGNKALRIKSYMDGLPDDVKKDVKWKQNADDLTEGTPEDTKAVLKAYGYMRYQYYLSDATEDFVYQLLLERYEQTNIADINEDIKMVIKGILGELKQDAEIKENEELLYVMAVIRQYIENLKEIPVNGNRYYQILYYTYIDNKYNLNAEEVMTKLHMSRTHFYRLMKKAIEELSNIIWKN